MIYYTFYTDFVTVVRLQEYTLITNTGTRFTFCTLCVQGGPKKLNPLLIYQRIVLKPYQVLHTVLSLIHISEPTRPY